MPSQRQRVFFHSLSTEKTMRADALHSLYTDHLGIKCRWYFIFLQPSLGSTARADNEGVNRGKLSGLQPLGGAVGDQH